MSRPWLKFYPTDWRADPALRSCSVAARGLWMELLCLMHEASPRGWLLINGRSVSDRQIASLAGSSIDEVAACLKELEEAGVFSRDGNGDIYSRRMHRDEEKAALDKANGATGGNPALKGGDNPPGNKPDKAQIPESRDQDTSLRSVAREPKTARRKTSIERDWQISEKNREDAGRYGVAGAQLGIEVEKFRDHHLKTGSVFKDWDAAWRTWCQRVGEFSRGPPTMNGSHKPPSAAQAAVDALESLKSNPRPAGLWANRDADQTIDASVTRRTG